MAFETKQEILERLLKADKPHCPHCKVTMTIWEVPDIAVGDGLGWGTPYLFICLNDHCPSFENGWKTIEENFAHRASYRCINYPGTQQYEVIPVYSHEGGKGQAIDEKALLEQEALKESIKAGFSILTDYYLTKAWDEILKILLDPLQPNRVRLKAAEMIGDIGDTEAVEPLLNHKFPNDLLSKQVEKAIGKLHERHYTRECPFCAEIIKKRAKVCRHCNAALN